MSEARPSREYFDEQVRGACAAMALFMIFVWMEMQVDHGRDAERQSALGLALQRGYFEITLPLLAKCRRCGLHREACYCMGGPR